MALSMVFSMLLHMLVFYSFIFLLQLNKPKPEEKKATNLQVRLVQPLPPKVQTKPGIKLLSAPTSSEFKVAQTPTKPIPDANQKRPAPIVAQAAPAAEEVEGIAFPSAIATPFPGTNRARNSIFNARSSQQNAARTYHQQAMEAQTRQRTEQQAQLVMGQLQQMLTKLLDVEPALTGKCVMAETDTGLKNGLQCDSAALQKLVHNDQLSVAGMLLMLNGMGLKLSGFSVTNNNKQPAVTLHNDPLPDSFSRKMPLTPRP